MNWLFFAILAPFIYSINVAFDKYILEKHVADYRGMPIYGALAAPFFGLILWIITGFPILTLRDSILIIFTGILMICAAGIYFKALSSDESSNITFLFQITPIIVLILSFLFLKESINSNQFFGFALILFATISVSINKAGKFSAPLSSFFLLLVTDILWALSYVIFKFVVEVNTFSKVVSYESLGIGLGGLILYLFFPGVRKAFIKTNKKIGQRVMVYVFLNEGLYIIGRLVGYLAVSIGPVGLVSVVGGIQVLFSILIGWILTIIVPKIFKENITKKGLSKKIIMAGLVLLGLWFIQG